MIHLRWAKAKDGWLPLALPWPSVIDTVGVYAFGMRAIRAASCGSGTARLGSAFTITRKIPKCWPSRCGTLRVTWAAVQSDQMEGVERYLVEHWKPLGPHTLEPVVQTNGTTTPLKQVV